MKYVNKLSDAELIDICKSFMAPEDKFVDVAIERYDDSIELIGHIRIEEEDEEYADADGYIEIEECYSLMDYYAKSYNHSGDMTNKLRAILYSKFGISYAEDFLFISF